MPSQDRLSIAVLVAGGFGDSLIALAWVKELYRHLDEKVHIDLYGRSDLLSVAAYMHSHIASILGSGLFSLASGYDLKLKIAHFCLVIEANTPRIASKSRKLFDIVQKLRGFAERHKKYAYRQPQFDGVWADYCNLQGWNRWDELGANEAIPFSRHTWGVVHINCDHFSVPEKYGLAGQPFITIHAGGDTAYHTSSHGSRIWPLAQWGQFCRLFKERYPHIAIVQLGAGFQTPIEGADLVLLGKISLAESMVVLKRALLHVDGESGLVHFRRQLGGKSVVLFGPTSDKFKGYAGNINIVSQLCSNCEWMTNDSLLNCPRGFAQPECLQAINPESVMEAVSDALAGRKEYTYAVSNPALYSSAGQARNQQIIDEICVACSLEKKPISEHIYGPGRTYIHASKQWEYPYALEHINSLGSGPLRIADVGGGRGMLAWYMAQKGHAVTVYDINYLCAGKGNADVENQYIQFARDKGFEADFGSIFNIPAEDDSFDVVTCISVVEHILWKEYAVLEMLRVLKPGGKLILTYDLVMNVSMTSTEEASRVEIFTPQAICGLLKKFGIAVDELHSLNDVRASLNDIKEDSVNIAPDMTVGGFVLRKEIARAKK